MTERNPFGDLVSAEGIGKVKRDWFRVYYGQLAGAVVEAVRLDVQRWRAFPCFVVRTRMGKRLLVRVTNGGGKPGHLHIEPLAGEGEP